MSFPRYPKYKASGVEWLGDVPDHWDVFPCRNIVQEKTAKNDDAKCQDYLSLMANVGVLPYAEKGDVGNKKPEDLSKCKIVSRGDFVINSMNYGIGSYGLSEYDGVCSPVYIVLKPKNDIVESRFAFRIFEGRSFQKYAQSFGNGILEHRSAINWDILKSIGVGIPSLEEQRSILEFLDRETGKIDELVAEQRRLMELLKEKRQAVISHAVTKGLNPHAPMKPSGIEWLGDVPEHWEVVPIKWLSPVKRGASPRPIDDPKYFDEEGEFAWVRIADVSACDGVLSETTQRLSTLGSSLSVKILPGELFVSIAGTVGKPCISAIKACIHDGFVYFPTLKIEPRFLFRIFEAGDCYGGLGKWGTQLNLNTDTVGSIRVAVPPPDELKLVLDFLDAESSRFDTLTAEAQRTIDLLQERRTALISAAVTGQIDVRHQPRN